jgi:hypothetical protein
MAGLLDALGLSNKGNLDKLKIESWTSFERPEGAADKVFEAFINPSEITLNYNILTAGRTTPGKNGTDSVYLGSDPLELSLKFMLDGTNVTGQPLNVVDKIQEFYETVGYDGSIHRTRYLRISWGNFSFLRPNQFALDGEFKSASIQYKLFKPNGTPLRALITCSFIEKLKNEEREAEERNSSPDLTHVRIVKEGDTLPMMCLNIYGDIKYYLEIAKVNKLKDFRNLQSGSKIFFPPLETHKL